MGLGRVGQRQAVLDVRAQLSGLDQFGEAFEPTRSSSTVTPTKRRPAASTSCLSAASARSTTVTSRPPGRSARRAVETLLRLAAAAHTDPSHPPGCLVINGATNCTPAAAEVKAELRSIREQAKRCLTDKINVDVEAGRLPEPTRPPWGSSTRPWSSGPACRNHPTCRNRPTAADVSRPEAAGRRPLGTGGISTMTGLAADAVPPTSGRRLPFREQHSDIVGMTVAGVLGSFLPVIGVHFDDTVLLGAVDQLRLIAAAVVLAVALGSAFLLMQIARTPVLRGWPRHPQLVLLGVLLADTAAVLLLEAITPFRTGLLSLLLYCLPAPLVALATSVRSRAATRAAVAGLVALYLLAVPVRLLQQHLAAQQWLHRTGAPRSLAQVVRLPGMTQEPYYRHGSSLIALFDPSSGNDLGGAAEVVTPGYTNPCGPLYANQGDAWGYETDPCTRVGPGLWQRGTDGYVLQRNGLTISLTEDGLIPVHDTVLLRATRAAHPASDAELWTREGRLPADPLNALLL